MNEYQKIDRVMDPMDARAFQDAQAISAELPVAMSPVSHRAPPAKVDLGKHLHYIRCQSPSGAGGSGCFAFATLAVWDIMNEMACPYTPNLAITPWMFFHRRRDAWENSAAPGIVTRDGRFISFKSGPEYWFFQVFGNPTEGTEMTGYPTMPWCGQSTVEFGNLTLEGRPNIGWTVEGINEAHNYRLDGLPSKLAKINSQSLMEQLAAGYPIRVQVTPDPQLSGHVQALVGYDFAAQTFTFVDSYGDRKHNNGFGKYSFAEIDNSHKPLISQALIFKIRKPLPVPAARISFTHSNRMNVALWLSLEGSPIPKRQIWPPPQFHDDCSESFIQGRWFPWDDNSRNLTFTVRAPSELMWPPGPSSRLVLDLHDAAAVSNTGGHLVEFTGAFGGDVMKCQALSSGPVPFGPHTHQRFYIG